MAEHLPISSTNPIKPTGEFTPVPVKGQRFHSTLKQVASADGPWTRWAKQNIAMQDFDLGFHLTGEKTHSRPLFSFIPSQPFTNEAGMQLSA